MRVRAYITNKCQSVSRTLLFVVYFMMLSVSRLHSVEQLGDHWTGEDLEGSGHGQLDVISQSSVWNNWKKQYIISVKIDCVPAEI